MGNCQAAEAAAVVIQHPGGKVERLYGPATAGDVMRSNPGHYVALVVLRVSGVGAGAKQKQVVQHQDAAIAAAVAGKGGAAARITKVKLLKPMDGLLLGQVYRLITSQEVAKAIQARRQERTRRRCEDAAAVDGDHRRPGQHATSSEELMKGRSTTTASSERLTRPEKNNNSRPRSSSGRGRHWQPSLKSISEFPTSS